MRLHRTLAAAVAASALIAAAGPAGPAAAEAPPAAPVTYRPPVDAPLADGFRPPANPYGAGNRGIDYATEPGQPVVAAAPGQVVFAGRVGNGLHVTVLHADGLRTSYSFLAEVAVRRGDRVEAGAVLGTAGAGLHFGARAGEAYVDPMVLLGASRGPRVWLVPDDLRRPLSEGDERGLLVRALRGVRQLAGAGAGAVAWAAEGAVDVAAGAAAGAAGIAARAAAWAGPTLLPGPMPLALAGATVEWWRERDECTPGSAALPPPPDERRLAVLVGGLGSSSGHAAILDVDTTTLGYAREDVMQFSYTGGTAGESAYGPADTQVDIRASGARLRALLDRLAADHPGVPIDVLAHSQGGLVTRAALGGAAPVAVGNVVTLATPHQGADLATAGARLRWSTGGATALAVAGAVGPAGIDPTSTSVGQLAETSELIAELNARPLPEGPRYVSIAARYDLVVPVPRTALPGAEHAVVSLPPGFTNHDGLPGSPQATRELALALAGLPLSCRGLVSRLADAATGTGVSMAEDALGFGLTAAGGLPMPPR